MAGEPGASASNGTDRAGRTLQRLCAALERGTASPRRTMTGVPDFSAASTSRRLAVRS